jgi:hypothetical protein
MAFSTVSKKSGVRYFLHKRMVTLKGGRQQEIYFFAKDERKPDALSAVPAGYEVSESGRSGLPVLKKTAVVA